MDEPSLLDYLKERLDLRRILRGEAAKPPILPLPDKPEEAQDQGNANTRFPWRVIPVLLLALLGQRFFEPGSAQPALGIIFYMFTVGLLIFLLIKKDWQLPTVKPDEADQLSLRYRRVPLIIFVPLFLLTFFLFSGNQFTFLNVLLWIATFISALAAFWLPGEKSKNIVTSDGTTGFLSGGIGGQRINRWHLLLLLVFLISAWFHLSQIATVPLEMTSDHTEKLLDLKDVVNGNLSIFFPRNSGREPIQFYLAAILVKVFGMEMNFTVLKLSMALAFLASLFYVYLLGQEVGNRWTGLLAMLLVGFASWPNILARSGMRLVLTPVFVAPVLFYLLRGLRLSRRNDLVLAGVFLGLGLLGYSAFRVMPLVVIIIFVIYMARQNRIKKNDAALGGLGVVVIFALIGALPLLRYAIEYPEIFAYRMATRMTGAEQAIQGSAFVVFLQNLVKAAAMPFWRDGETWIISVINRPALDLITAALYILGVGILIYAWISRRNWQYLVLLVSIPMLMLPSILALAFPNENPSLSRAGGAVIPVILVAVIALQSLLSTLWQPVSRTGGRFVVIFFAAVLISVSADQNHDLVFRQYQQQYRSATWNTSQMGAIAREFIKSNGQADTIWVVAVPYWVDTRLVAANAGYLGSDFQVWPDDLPATLGDPRAKLFFVKVDDFEGMEKLMSIYPNGVSQYHTSDVPGREFFTYVVPAVDSAQ